jgi:hypothetical protein
VLLILSSLGRLGCAPQFDSGGVSETPGAPLCCVLRVFLAKLPLR